MNIKDTNFIKAVIDKLSIMKADIVKYRDMILAIVKKTIKQ
jgi:hypothetical protein